MLGGNCIRVLFSFLNTFGRAWFAFLTYTDYSANYAGTMGWGKQAIAETPIPEHAFFCFIAGVSIFACAATKEHCRMSTY